MFDELATKKMNRKRLILELTIHFSVMSIVSPIGMFLLSLLMSFIPALIHCYIMGFNINFIFIALGIHFVVYQLILKAKFERELLPGYFAMKEATKILKNRLSASIYEK